MGRWIIHPHTHMWLEKFRTRETEAHSYQSSELAVLYEIFHVEETMAWAGLGL
jgi:hypothetical protein